VDAMGGPKTARSEKEVPRGSGARLEQNPEGKWRVQPASPARTLQTALAQPIAIRKSPTAKGSRYEQVARRYAGLALGSGGSGDSEDSDEQDGRRDISDDETQAEWDVMGAKEWLRLEQARNSLAMARAREGLKGQDVSKRSHGGNDHEHSQRTCEEGPSARTQEERLTGRYSKDMKMAEADRRQDGAAVAGRAPAGGPGEFERGCLEELGKLQQILKDDLSSRVLAMVARSEETRELQEERDFYLSKLQAIQAVAEERQQSQSYSAKHIQDIVLARLECMEI
jgi:hypothetical protein